MTKTTLQQVALKAGVSKTTASLVLNGKSDSVNIAETTRKRVLAVAKELNYHPGKFNPGKLNGKSGIIGVLASDFSNFFIRRWMQGCIEASEKKGYVILPQLVTSENLEEKAAAVPFDAGIVLQPELINHFTGLAQAEFPLVCAGFIPDSEKHKTIAPNFTEQTNELIQNLYRHNKKAIACLVTKQDTKEKRIKTTTYQENYCERFDISPNIAELTSKELNPKEIKEACLQLIENGANAIILETPEMAFVAMKNAEVRNLVKHGVLFATYDKIEGSELLPESLLIHTTPDIAKMAKEVIEECIKGVDS